MHALSQQINKKSQVEILCFSEELYIMCRRFGIDFLKSCVLASLTHAGSPQSWWCCRLGGFVGTCMAWLLSLKGQLMHTVLHKFELVKAACHWSPWRGHCWGHRQSWLVAQPEAAVSIRSFVCTHWMKLSQKPRQYLYFIMSYRILIGLILLNKTGQQRCMHLSFPQAPIARRGQWLHV